jgi:methylmalonyl-CoA epimerase
MVTRIDHVAVIVKDLDAAIKSYSDMFGFKVVETMDGPGGEFKSVTIANGDMRLEFFQPLKPGGFQKFLDERGGGLHHISFATNDIEGELKNLKAQGRRLQSEEPMILPNGDKVAFIHPSAAENVLIELVQRASGHE